MKLTDIMSLGLWMEVEEELCEDYSVNAFVFDAQCERLTENAEFGNKLCPAVKAVPAGEKTICSPALQGALRQAEQSRQTVFAECSTGLTVACVPVFAEEVFSGAVCFCGMLTGRGEVDGFMIEQAAAIPEKEAESLGKGIVRMSQERAEEIAAYVENSISEYLED